MDHLDTNSSQCNLDLINLDIKPQRAVVEDDKLHIVWPDEHVSVYPSCWLLEHILRDQFEIPPPNSENTVLWCGLTWSSLDALPVRINYNDLITHPDEPVRLKTLTALLEDLYIYGFALVEKTPPTVEATRYVAQSISHFRNTIFGGDFWDYQINENNPKDELQFSDTAYTTGDIKPHTDGSYCADPPGVQVFHCLEHKGDGGINTLVDGWYVAQELEKHHPDVFQYLSSTPIDFYYSDIHHSIRTQAQVIKKAEDGSLVQIRFNNHDRMAPHPFRSDLPIYNKSIKILQQYLENENYNISIKLHEGTVLMTYGWRVLHSRTPFNGSRRMAGCYIDADQFLSKYRVLKRTSHSLIELH